MRKLTRFVFILLCMHSAQADRFYVDANASAGGNGQSWAAAFQFLQDALDQTVAGRGDEVWIAEGTYYPDDGASVTEGDRTASFVLKDGVSLYGGFQGNETELSQRDIATHESVLSGSISANQISWSLHVCTVGENASVALHGLTVRDGNANGTPTNINDVGGAVYAASQTTSLIEVTNCLFTNNTADKSAGVGWLGVWTVTGSTFSGNSSGVEGGVGSYGSWTVVDSTFSGNSATQGGVDYRGTWTVTGCTFSGNSASVYGGVAYYGSWTVANSIIDALNTGAQFNLLFQNLNSFQNFVTPEFPDPSVPRAKNIIQGGTDVIQATTLDVSTGFIINADPMFVNASDPDGPDGIFGTADDGFRLQAGSPAIAEGNADFLPEDTYDLDNDGNTSEPLPVDRAGFQRVQGGNLDLGAYEFTGSTQPMFTLTVLSDGNGGVTPSGSQNYAAGANETVTATPNPGYLFDQWSGSVNTNTNPLVVTINTNVSITANFTPDLSDPDEDGLSNYDEVVTYGTDPNDGDTSGDGILDGAIVDAGYDPQENYGALIGLVTNNPSAYNLYSESEIAEMAVNGVVLTNSGAGFEVEWIVETNSTLNATDWQVHERVIRPVDMGNGVLFMRVRSGAVE